MTLKMLSMIESLEVIIGSLNNESLHTKINHHDINKII